MPPPLLRQLADGGRMTIPVGPPGAVQTLWLIERRGDQYIRTNQGGRDVCPVRKGGPLRDCLAANGAPSLPYMGSGGRCEICRGAAQHDPGEAERQREHRSENRAHHGRRPVHCPCPGDKRGACPPSIRIARGNGTPIAAPSGASSATLGRACPRAAAPAWRR